MSVLRLALDVHDPLQRRRLERMFEAAYRVRRALQRAARNRVRAYWAAPKARARDASGTRATLGLSRTAFEQDAYAHLDAAPHLRRHVTKALAMHLADSVWSAVERHLFRDATGKRQGLLHVGRWYDFARLPGSARSHTRARKWETFRLHGSLAGHRAAYTGRDGDFAQPRHLDRHEADEGADWWTYEGPLALVFSGLADGTLVLPVRLPTAPCNQPILDHHLADPRLWHKVDLVRSRAPHAPGGWRYEAHLMVLTAPFVSPSAKARREEVAVAGAGRVAGIDVNVSNLTIASQMAGGDLRLTRIERDGPTTARDRGQRRRERRRQRALERSRRAANREQYQLSRRQEKRARRRAAAGLPALEVIPQGPRVSRGDGVPLVAYRRDRLSNRYHLLRAGQVADAAASAQARRDRARRIAAEVVRTHGCQLVVEDVAISAWARRWGRARGRLHPGAARRRHRPRSTRRRRWPARHPDPHPHDRALAALPLRCPRAEDPRRPHSPVPELRTPGRSRRRLRGARGLHRPRPACRARLRARRLRRGRAGTRTHPGASSPSPTGVARHPVRVNRPLRARGCSARVANVHTGDAGGSANRRHGRGSNPG